MLFFSLEQSRFELVTKGLSRLTAQLNIKFALTAMEIREGTISETLKKAEDEYIKFAEHEIIYECGFDTNIEMIVNCVKNYMYDNKVTPIVIVDYLQIIRPWRNRIYSRCNMGVAVISDE